MTSSERLPRKAYTDAAWNAQEQETLFRNAWVFAGLTSDFSQTGDVKRVSAGAFPLIVLLGQDGELSAFQNVCRHRGAELVEQDGPCGGVLVCPYHRWSYGLDGQFRGAPKMEACFPGADKSQLSLKPAAVGVFKNLVFVNPNPDADFAAWSAGLEDKAWPHMFPSGELIESKPFVYDMKCDWKVFVENAIDGYHLAYLHEETLGGPEVEQNVWDRVGDHMIWYATDDASGARQRMTAKIRRDVTGYPMVTGTTEPGYGGVYYLFPTTFVTPNPFGISISTFEPLGAGRCHLVVRHWGQRASFSDRLDDIPGFDPDTGRISSDNWKVHPLESGDFQTEDVWICEKVQRGLASPAYEHGPLSEGAGAEDPIRWFHESYHRLANMP